MRAGSGGPGRRDPVPGGRGPGPGRPRRGFPNPWPAVRRPRRGGRGGSAGLSSCCPQATPPKRPSSPGYRDTVSSRRPSAGGKTRAAAGASGDLGWVAGRPRVGETTVSSTVPGVTGPDATGPSPATIGPYDVPGMPGGLPAACCSAGTSSSTRRPRGSPGPPSRPCSRQVRPPGSRAGRQRAAGGSSVTFRFRCSLSCSDPPRPRTRRSRLPYLQPGDLD